MQKHNLLNGADDYVQEIAHGYLPRAPFAFEQTLSDSVKLKSLYTDDVDLCFVFEVEGMDVDVYCNYGRATVCGHVYNTGDSATAARVLREHFALVATDLDEDGDCVYYGSAIPA